MRFTIERSGLMKSLSHIQNVVERRNTIPILSNVLLQAAGGSLTLTATDLDTEIIETIDADVVAEGGTTAPAHLLYEIVRKLPDGAQVDIEYSQDDQRLHVKGGRSRFTIACLPRDDFPEMSTGELPVHFAIEAADLARLIDKTRFAISNEETRYYLNGIYVHAATDSDGGKTLRAVATDGHRLARYDLPTPKGAEDMPGIIVPRKAIAEIRKLVDDGSGAVEIALSDTKIRFEFDGIVLTSKLIDGTFPDYNRVIPQGNDKSLILHGADFAHAVDRVATISDEKKSRAVKLNLEQDRMTLSVVSPESGSATEELSVEYSSGPIEVGFNANYLLDITRQLDGEQAQFWLADPGSPTLVRDMEDDRALYVLMPMRV